MTDDAPERRASDAAIAVLQVQQKTMAEDLSETKGLLREHVTGCTKLQKWVLGVLLFLAGWLVAHSPEGLKVLTKIVEAL